MMNEALQLLTVAAVSVALGIWGLYQGRRERLLEKRTEDVRQQSIYFPENDQERHEQERHRGAAMSRLP